MNEAIQAALAPLAAFWIALEGFIKIANFANGMRDIIIMGVMNETNLTLRHRQAMFTDWMLSISGFVIADIMFGVMVLLLAKIVPQAEYAIYVVGATTILGAILFIICGVSDYRAIKDSLIQADKSTGNVHRESQTK